MWYVYTTEYYSFIEKNKILPFSATQIAAYARSIDGPRESY